MDASPSPVLPEYGPTLPALLAAVVVALVALYVLVLRNPTRNVVHHGAPTFNFSYQPGQLHRVAPARGELYRLEQRTPSGRLLQALSARALRLPPYRGAVSGALPLYAARDVDALRRRYPG